ncbi:hypothetical protein IKG_05990, partial [Bacillus cereus VD200]
FNIFLSVIRTFLSTKGCAPNYFLQFPLRGSPTIKQYVLNIIHLCNQYGRFIKKIVTPLFMWGCDCKIIIVSFKISHVSCSSNYYSYILTMVRKLCNRTILAISIQFILIFFHYFITLAKNTSSPKNVKGHSE